MTKKIIFNGLTLIIISRKCLINLLLYGSLEWGNKNYFHTFTHRAEAEARNKSLVEEAVGEESYGRHGVDNGEHIVELERTLSGSMVGLESSRFSRKSRSEPDDISPIARVAITILI